MKLLNLFFVFFSSFSLFISILTLLCFALYFSPLSLLDKFTKSAFSPKIFAITRQAFVVCVFCDLFVDLFKKQTGLAKTNNHNLTITYFVFVLCCVCVVLFP